MNKEILEELRKKKEAANTAYDAAYAAYDAYKKALKEYEAKKTVSTGNTIGSNES